MAFMGKTFLDGYKDIWIKRKEANIHKNLQENLIDVETQSFSGKMQIIRSMLSKYTTDFEKYIKNNNEKILPNFGKLTLSQIPFTSNDKQEKIPTLVISCSESELLQELSDLDFYQ